MGMYTEFYFKATLKKDTPDSIIKLIQSIINFEYSSNFMKEGYRSIRREHYSNEITHDYYIDLGISHPFLDCSRVELLFFYSNGKACNFYQNQQGMYILKMHSDIKNYDSEIDLFLDFIKPYVQIGRKKQKFLGWHRYEDADDRTYLHLINDTNEIKETYIIINYTKKVSVYAKALEKQERKALKRLKDVCNIQYLKKEL